MEIDFKFSAWKNVFRTFRSFSFFSIDSSFTCSSSDSGVFFGSRSNVDELIWQKNWLVKLLLYRFWLFANTFAVTGYSENYFGKPRNGSLTGQKSWRIYERLWSNYRASLLTKFCIDSMIIFGTEINYTLASVKLIREHGAHSLRNTVNGSAKRAMP